MKYICLDDWQKYSQLNLLRDLSKPPKSLYVRGEFNPEIFSECVAVVGSRKITNYGRQVMDKLIPQLAYEGKTIVSGFMYGVDQYAHRLCMENGGKTIAVLGWGIAHPMDEVEEKLAKQIIQTGGMLISEWENQQGALWTFPIRNRIVAALAREIYVVEAAIKSGSLLTAEWGRTLKRQVWAVPGPITSRVSEGTNNLIAGGQATAWLGKPAQQLPLNQSNNPLLNLLWSEPLSANEIARKLSESVAKVGAQLSLLTVTNQITEREGKYYLNNAN